MRKIITKLQSMGLNVIPLHINSKIPSLNWKIYQYDQYDGEFPDNCNIGIICGKISQLIVIDLDDKSLYKEFSECHYNTFIVETDRGYHLYFRSNEVIKSSKLIDYKGRGIDIKAEGNYVVAPESIHPKTKIAYKIICNQPIREINFKYIKDKLNLLGFFEESKDSETLDKYR